MSGFAGRRDRHLCRDKEGLLETRLTRISRGEATLSKSCRWAAPRVGMGCKAQTAAIAQATARICNAADHPRRGCSTRQGLVQRRPTPRAARVRKQSPGLFSSNQRVFVILRLRQKRSPALGGACFWRGRSDCLNNSLSFQTLVFGGFGDSNPIRIP